MHIAFLIHDANTLGAVMTVTRRQAQYLSSQGHRVTVISNEPGASWETCTMVKASAAESRLGRKTTSAFIRLLSVPRTFSGWRFMAIDRLVAQKRSVDAIARSLEHVHREIPVDVVVYCQHPIALAANPFTRKHKVPSVLVAHGDVFAHPTGSFSLPLDRFYKQSADYAYKNTARIFCVSKSLCRRAIARGAHRQQVLWIPNGVDADEIGWPPEKKAGRKAQYELLSVGRCEHEKGHHQLIQALKTLNGLDVHLRIIGTGSRLPALRRLAEESGVSDRCTFEGAVTREQLGYYYAMADLYVQPSLSEAMPLAIMEALVAGLPIVATRIGGIPDMVTHGTNGLLVDIQKGYEELADAIRKLCLDAGQRRTFSEASKVIAGEYSWRIVLQRFNTALLECVADHAAPPPSFLKPEDRLNIAHIHTSDHGGGAEAVALNTHLALLARGYNSILFVGRKRTDHENVFAIPGDVGVPGLKKLCLWLEKYFGLQYLYSPSFRRLRWLIPKDTDILHIHSLTGAEGYADIAALPVLTRKFPSLFWLNDTWLMTGHCAGTFDCERWKIGCGQCPYLDTYPAIPRDGTHFNWKRKQRMLKRCHGMVAGPSSFIVERAGHSPILQHLPRQVIPNGINLEKFRPAKDMPRLRQALDLPVNECVVLISTKDFDSPFKGVEQAIQAINHIKGHTFHTILIGQASHSLVSTIDGKVTAVPFLPQDQLIPYYQTADILLMPSLEESFGLVAAEAMACGTAVIAYAAGGLPSVVGADQERAGILVPTGAWQQMSAALSKLLSDPESLDRIKKNARRRVEERFDMEKQIDAFLALYAMIIKDHHARSRTA